MISPKPSPPSLIGSISISSCGRAPHQPFTMAPAGLGGQGALELVGHHSDAK